MGDGRRLWRAANRWWLLAGLVLVLLVAGGTWRALAVGKSRPAAAPATVAVDRGPVTTEVATTGTLQPAQTRSLSFAATGTVQSVAVRPGTLVTKGQVLARIDDTDARAAVGTAQDAFTAAGQALDDARTAASRAAATPAPATGCLAVGARTAAMVPAVAPAAPLSVDSVDLVMRGTSPTPTHSPTARPPGTPPPTRPSPSAPATRPAPRPTATPGVPPRTGRPGNTPGGATRTTPPARCTTPGNGSGANGPGGNGSGGNGSGGNGSGGNGSGGDAILTAQQRLNRARVTLAEAEQTLRGTTITAPIAGRVLSVVGPVGTRLTAGATYLTLADVFAMQVSAAFAEADADALAAGQHATVSLANHPGHPYAATVLQVDPVGASDGTMVRYGTLLAFVEAPKDLLVGQSAAVRVTTHAATDVLRVPATAVHEVGAAAGVVLRDVGASNRQADVGVGLRGDAYVEITSGLAVGDPVIQSW